MKKYLYICTLSSIYAITIFNNTNMPKAYNEEVNNHSVCITDKDCQSPQICQRKSSNNTGFCTSQKTNDTENTDQNIAQDDNLTTEEDLSEGNNNANQSPESRPHTKVSSNTYDYNSATNPYDQYL